VSSLRFPVAHPTDAAVARSLALRFAREQGVSEKRAQEVAIIAGELASNLVRHGAGGTMDLLLREGSVIVRSTNNHGDGEVPRALLEAVGDSPIAVDDSGAFRAGLGCGFGAVRRLSDAFHVRCRADGALEVSASCRTGA
jgi:serine/threonine-protein kinase RsbT